MAELVPVEEMGTITPEDELEVIDLDAPAATRPREDVTSSLPTIMGDLESGAPPPSSPALEVMPPEAEETGVRPAEIPVAQVPDTRGMDQEKQARLRAELEEAQMALHAITRTLAGLGEQAVRLSEKLEGLKKMTVEPPRES